MLEDLFDLSGEERESAAFSPSYSFRAKRRAVRLANFLLDGEGKLIRLDEAIAFLENEGQINLPVQFSDTSITAHMLKVLRFLESDTFLSQFSLPLASTYLEDAIAATLGIESLSSDRDVIWGVLSALLCPIRQSIGSCFATAPALLVHEEFPELFLLDLQSLLVTGLLTRVISGIEYTVPVSPSPGLGALRETYADGYPPFAKALEVVGLDGDGKGITYLDHLTSILQTARSAWREEGEVRYEHLLQKAKTHFVGYSDHLLLKIWEFSLASFVDVKTEFSGWNLFASLGLKHDEPGGIGALVYSALGTQLEEANREVEKHQGDYEISFDQVRATERLLKNAGSSEEARRLKGEHQARVFQMIAAQRERDKWNDRAQKIANFFNFYLDAILENFPHHFQEAYDPEMLTVHGTRYDDSPAGFRLLHKHGRTHAASWTFIQSKEEYIQALRAFFLALEHPCREEATWEGGEILLTHLTTQILHHIEREEFLISAFARMAKTHGIRFDPDKIDSFEKKPWAYTSGGTLPTLLKTYFRREGEITEISRRVESPQELLIFFLDTLKGLSPYTLAPYMNNPSARMLATSPTHAFALFPGLPPFRAGWEDSGFSYTWVRDEIEKPSRDFWDKMTLTTSDTRQIALVISHLLDPVTSRDFQAAFTPTSGKLLTFRNELRALLPAAYLSKIDQLLYEMLPFASPAEVKALPFDIPIPDAPISRLALHNHLVAHFPRVSHTDPNRAVAVALRNAGLAPPAPLIFADTNWEKLHFAFVVHPATGNLDLFVTDVHGITGSPIEEWRPFLSGSGRSHWTLMPYRHEYTATPPSFGPQVSQKI